MTKKPFCPNEECESAHIVPVKDQLKGGTRWTCKNCKDKFEEPEYREPKNDPRHHGRSGMAKELVDMDPDEL